MLAMTLSEIADRMLKGSGCSQPPQVKGPPTEPRSSLASLEETLQSPESDANQVAGRGGMTTSTVGDPRALSANVPSWARMRPLSDIRELTEPSLVDAIPPKPLSDAAAAPNASLSRKPSTTSKHRPSIDSRHPEIRDPDRKQSQDTERHGLRSGNRGRASRTPSPPSPMDNSYSSIYSIAPGSVPPRSSSRARSASRRRQHQHIPPPPLQIAQRAPAPPSLNTVPSLPVLPAPPPRGSGHTIPRRRPSQSPLRQVAAKLDPISHDTHRRIPSRTFIREPLSNELLEFPTHRHPRVDLGLDLSAGIFVGGGSIEGTVQISIDDAERIRHRRTLDIARISIDLLGLEEMAGNKRSVFLNLATELIDEDNPPPANMVDSQEPIDSATPFWHLMPSVTNLPFMMSLPLNVGPPPFQSKNARIRYSLCVSLLIRDHGKQYIVRTSEDITVLSVYDPEKALMSLPSPLTASDEWVKPRDVSVEVVRITAGLHRQVWVSGTSIYVDVHIANHSRKTIKKIELQLERDILCYKHAAASTMEKSASQARIFDSNERSILSKSMTKQGTAGWHGVPAHNTHIRTCDLEVPRGHATVKCGESATTTATGDVVSLSCKGKYFEVRYFLNVVVSSSHTKLVTVQLPIVLIHMNSLDVVPNSVAQVAAAIEEKRTAHAYPRSHSPPRLGRRPSQSVQGRAFAAPRMQSLERMRAQAEDLQELSQALDQSPRKISIRRNPNYDYHTPPSNRKGRIVANEDMVDLQRRLRRVQSNETLASKAASIYRANSIISKRAGSALGFRDAEVRDDIELGGLGVAADPSFKQRLEQSRERQYRFGKKRSVERWKGVANVGVGWLKGNAGGKDERERDGWV